MAKRTVRASSTKASKAAGLSSAQANDEGAPRTRARFVGSELGEEEIRMRAYSRYLERGGGHGQDIDDWIEAERELKRRA